MLLEEMANALVSAIDILSVDAVQLPHSQRKIPIRGFDQQVKMVRHQTIRMTNPVEPLARPSQYVQKCSTVVSNVSKK